MIDLDILYLANNFYEIIKALNDASNGMIWVALLFLSMILPILIFRQPFKAKFLAASFLTTLLGVLGFVAKFGGWPTLIMPLLILLASIIIYLTVE